MSPETDTLLRPAPPDLERPSLRRRGLSLFMLAVAGTVIAVAVAVLAQQPGSPVALITAAADVDGGEASHGDVDPARGAAEAQGGGAPLGSGEAEAQGGGAPLGSGEETGAQVVTEQLPVLEPAHPRQTSADSAPPVMQRPAPRPADGELPGGAQADMTQPPGPTGRREAVPEGQRDPSTHSRATVEAARGQPARDRLTVDRVQVDAPAFVVIREDRDGRPGRIIGHKAVPAGESTAITVYLDESIEGQEAVFLHLHHDVEEDGRFDFPRSDPPMSTPMQRLAVAAR